MGPDISTYSDEIGCTALGCLCPGNRKSKHLGLQLLCLKGLVTKFLWKMLSDSKEKKQAGGFKTMCFHSLNCKKIIFLNHSWDGY